MILLALFCFLAPPSSGNKVNLHVDLMAFFNKKNGKTQCRTPLILHIFNEKPTVYIEFLAN